MNKILKYMFGCMAAGLLLVSCVKEIDPDPIRVQKPIDLGDAYYARLREYKKSKHQIAFGWMGRWTAIGPSGQKFLSSAPDSMDIISIWGAYSNLTPGQIADLRHVQQVKGTRVTFTVFSHNMTNLVGDALENTAENIPAAARMLADTVLKYGYDGIDFDHECSGSDLFYNPENMTTLLREMRQCLGPDKLIMVDGHLDYITEEGWQYANYGVQQAYGKSSGSLWSSVSKYITPDRFILTENFEDFWSGGGQLLKQAAWNPAEGVKGGCGSYHMEYEYAHTDVPYKWIRQAIQIMNPAQNRVVWKNDALTEEVVLSDEGVHIAGGKLIPLTAQVFRPLRGGLSVGVEYAPELADAYNEKYATELPALDASHLSLPERLDFADDSYFSSDAQFAAILRPEQLAVGSYLVPLRLLLDKGYDLQLDEEPVMYVRINVKIDEVRLTLSERGMQTCEVMAFPGGKVSVEEFEVEDVMLSMNYNAAEPIFCTLANDPALVAAYNEANGTSCTTPATSFLQLSGDLSIALGKRKSAAIDVKVVNLDRLPAGDHLFALRPTGPDPARYVCDDAQTLYLRIVKFESNVDNSETSVEGKLLDRTGWSYELESDVTTLSKPSQMFDGSTSTGWYSSKTGSSVATVTMEAPHTLAGFRVGSRYTSYKVQTLEQIETSLDGETWTTQVARIKGGTLASYYQYFRFFEPVECRYIRMTYVGARSGCTEFGAYEIQ